MTDRWGVIADDVTGACDVAAELRELGLDVAVVLGVPQPADIPRGVDAVVVGLGARTAPRERAVAESLAAAAALREAGAGRWYQKYCSTFDSTDEGMIGPVAEALVDAGGHRASVGTPATPHADRTVYRGHLFVGDRLLSESPLAHHPLTPMTDPDLVRVLSRQTTRPVALLDRRALGEGADAVAGRLAHASGHVIADALDDADLDVLADAIETAGDRVLPGGGAGLITALARRIRPSGDGAVEREHPEAGGDLVIAGSASARTREQLAAAGGPTVEIGALDADARPDDVVATALDGIRADLAAGRVPVVSAGHDEVAIAFAQGRLGVARAAAAVEAVLAEIARRSVAELGVRRLLVAGGETSGAVTRALGVRSLRLTRRVDPGVAWATGRASAVAGEPVVGVLLKSGNFGGVDLFTRAWEVAP
ncbi:four-carbon acid sugar kinase family protein [Protaetiibacter sp. SSC-01]|uniref:3-oxo-tetronate kinase n=1 Tax=Protaetiibacter sp. SSC-01 TaxID=2759943 RepID=UPI0016570E23|nr:3-oxo-tetronate kinase [Protaetiibacter sp. SSC-01]QNO37719.1 four-carbon acid sugar kinase family protein [Protaetiibacter sp. SSC-01]